MGRSVAWILSLLYVVVIVGANLLISHFGAWLTPYVAFIAIGFDFTIRDYIHDGLTKNRKLWMAVLITVAGLLTYVVNVEALWIAVGSSTAFIVANAADFAVYEYLINRSYLTKSNASNLVSTAVDSLLFISIAFGLTWELAGIATFQFAMKVTGGFFWSIVINKARTWI
jgi:hypothetical protein